MKISSPRPLKPGASVHDSSRSLGQKLKERPLRLLADSVDLAVGIPLALGSQDVLLGTTALLMSTGHGFKAMMDLGQALDAHTLGLKDEKNYFVFQTVGETLTAVGLVASATVGLSASAGTSGLVPALFLGAGLGLTTLSDIAYDRK